MPTEFNDPREKFEVVEVEVFEEDQAMDVTGYDPEAEINIPQNYQRENISEETQTRRRRRKKSDEKKYRKNKYGWAFFLCSMFLGIGITATTGAPLGIFGGMGVGFLFFVDPIYDKFMDKLENL
jgi:hypothetical protein